MKIGNRLLLPCLLLILSLAACEESETPNPDLTGGGYYPIQVGNFWTYQMEQIDYLVLGNDTSSYQLRELITDSLVNATGEVTYLISRQLWDEASLSWETDSIWSVRKNNELVVVTENGLPLVKLVFPVTIGETWDGHAFNNQGFRSFEYQSVAPSEVLTTVLSTDTLMAVRTVLSDIRSNIGRNERSEIYVNGVGLVQQDQFFLEICTREANCPNNLGDTLGGIFRSQVLIDYGKL